MANPALAASFADDMITQLTRQGFSDFTTETTWLGRVKIVAQRADGTREIILNPRTGEILRDTWSPLSASGGARPVLDEVGTNSGDNSGSGSSGSGSSGSGSSGSGSGSDDGGSDDNSGSGSDDSGGDRGDDREDREDKGDDKDGKDN